MLRLGEAEAATWTPLGAPLAASFIGGKAPWVVQKPGPKFGRVPVGLGHPKPTRKLPPFLSPN